MPEKTKRPDPGKVRPPKNGNSDRSDNTDLSGICQGVIAFTCWTSQSLLTKKISLNSNGELIKDGGCTMGWGQGEKAEIPFHEFPKILAGINKFQAISLGVPKDKNLPKIFNVESFKRFKGQPDTITRSLKHMEWEQELNSLLVIDYDPAKDADPLTPDEHAATLADVLPGFENAARVTTHSSSSCISDADGNEITGPSAGFHTYIMVPPRTDVKRFLEILKVRLWLAGHGYILISKSGSMNERNRLIDLFVFSPERLVYESGCHLKDGLKQNRPEPVYVPGGVFDPATLPDVTDAEREQYKSLVDEAKLAIAMDADKIRTKYIDTKADDLHVRKPESSLSACRATFTKACTDGDLFGDFEIHLDDGEVVTVGEIKKKPHKYDGMTCHDPIEPGCTAGKAQIFMNIGKGKGKPVIKSFWHGNHILFLHGEPAFEAKQAFKETMRWIEDEDSTEAIMDGWLDRITGMSPLNIECIKEAVHKKTKTLKGVLNTLLKEKKARDKKAKYKADTKHKKAKVEAEAKEKSQQREKAGIQELEYNPLHTGAFCEQISKVFRDNPALLIYRFAGGIINIVNKQPTTVRMVQSIHENGGKLPPMPTIGQFTKETLCHEIEKVVVCQIAKGGEAGKIIYEDIPCPNNVLAGIMALTKFYEKPLVGIVEHPYIDDNFKPEMTQGYDDKTGLFKVFNVVPDIGFFKDAGDALIFLIHELFKDFPFATDLDQMAAVGCLLTGMQRKLIPGGCPGFGFTAPIQASGKTALCQAIVHSLHGRPAAATSYSDDDAEMAKHILGILMEGHSAILFDNIAEGSVIESNEIAKVITSDTYSNRLLSKNKTATVPCSVLWLVTGNNISVCGDFNTRFLMIELDPKDANPDQRRFERDNIGAWCEQHRGKILGACMKIIMDGSGYSPDLKPTRFPSWDKFVRLPLHKISDIDIAEIFQKNKLSDPKIEGQNNFFEVWFNTFGDTPTTAMQVIEQCKVIVHSNPQKFAPDENEIENATRDIFAGAVLPGSKGLGKWLKKMKNRFFGEYKLVSPGSGTSGLQKNRTLWVVKKAE